MCKKENLTEFNDDRYTWKWAIDYDRMFLQLKDKPEQAGMLILSMIEYQRNQTPFPNFEDNLLNVFVNLIKPKMDIFNEKWEDIKIQRSKAGKNSHKGKTPHGEGEETSPDTFTDDNGYTYKRR